MAYGEKFNTIVFKIIQSQPSMFNFMIHILFNFCAKHIHKKSSLKSYSNDYLEQNNIGDTSYTWHLTL